MGLNRAPTGNIAGALAHTGTTVGLYGVTPAARTTGVAQLTDSTGGSADDVLVAIGSSTAESSTNQTQSALTDNSGGSASTTLAAVANATAASVDSSAASLASTNTTISVLKNAVASLAARLAELRVDVAAHNTTIQLAPTKASVDTQLTAVKNDLADLAAKLNVVMTALKSLGIIGA